MVMSAVEVEAPLKARPLVPSAIQAVLAVAHPVGRVTFAVVKSALSEVKAEERAKIFRALGPPQLTALAPPQGIGVVVATLVNEAPLDRTEPQKH